MSKKSNERWISYITKILDGESDHLFDEKNNIQTKMLVQACLTTLITGIELSQRQQDLLIKNIRLRIPGKQNFHWDKPISLTKKQKSDALKRKDIGPYLKKSRNVEIAHSILSKDLKEIIENVGTDTETLAALREHLKSFQKPEMVIKAVVETSEEVTIKKDTTETDNLLKQFGFSPKYEK